MFRRFGGTFCLHIQDDWIDLTGCRSDKKNQLWQNVTVPLATVLCSVTTVSAMKSSCVESFISEAYEIKLYRNKMNKEDAFSLNRSWEPIIQSKKKCTGILQQQTYTVSTERTKRGMKINKLTKKEKENISSFLVLTIPKFV